MSEPEHVCGLQGFGAPGDVCPACEAWRRSYEKRAPPADPIDDLCARLRLLDRRGGLGYDAHDWIVEAADELQRLRAERDHLRAIVEREGNRNDELNKVKAERDVYMRDVDGLRDVLTFGAEHGTAWHEAVRALAAERDTLAAIVRAADAMRLGLDCPMCDSGKLRNPQKSHWDSCAFANYDAARAQWGKP